MAKIPWRLLVTLRSGIPAQISPLTHSARTMATKIQKLTEAQRKGDLAPLLSKGWAEVAGRDAIAKTFTFKDFSEAWGWMSRVALTSETHNHHPEWKNVYNRVEVTWSTHDCGGLSAKDVTLATFCDRAYGKQ